MRTTTPRVRGRAASFILGASLLAAACGGSTTTTSAADTSASGDTATADSSAEATTTNAGNPLLTGSIGTVSGNQFDMASLEGQDAVLWFWAPW